MDKCNAVECFNKVEYEFRDTAEEGGLTFWCEEHVSDYMRGKRKKVHELARQKAEALLKEEVEREVDRQVKERRKGDFPKMVRKAVDQRLAVSEAVPGTFLDLISCGCVGGQKRDVMHYGDDWLYCATCQTLMGRGRVDGMQLSNHLDPYNKLGHSQIQLILGLQGSVQHSTDFAPSPAASDAEYAAALVDAFWGGQRKRGNPFRQPLPVGYGGGKTDKGDVYWNEPNDVQITNQEIQKNNLDLLNALRNVKRRAPKKINKP